MLHSSFDSKLFLKQRHPKRGGPSAPAAPAPATLHDSQVPPVQCNDTQDSLYKVYLRPDDDAPLAARPCPSLLGDFCANLGTNFPANHAANSRQKQKMTPLNHAPSATPFTCDNCRQSMTAISTGPPHHPTGSYSSPYRSNNPPGCHYWDVWL